MVKFLYFEVVVGLAIVIVRALPNGETNLVLLPPPLFKSGDCTYHRDFQLVLIEVTSQMYHTMSLRTRDLTISQWVQRDPTFEKVRLKKTRHRQFFKSFIL